MLEFVRMLRTVRGMRRGRYVAVPPETAAQLVADGHAEYVPTREVLNDE